MNLKRLLFGFGLTLVLAGQILLAQPSGADGKQLADIRAKAEKGDAKSQCALGEAFYSGKLGVAQDYAEAVKWFRKAAGQNDARAQYNLGDYYAFGPGATRDQAEAVKWFRKAAGQNDARAQYNLGLFYESGRGVAQDYVEAVKWYRKAAKQDYARAQNNLGVDYSKGQGVAQDEAEAVKWYRKAAGQYFAEAQINLAACYYKGKGVAPDYVEAYKWCLLAAAQGNEDGKNAVTKMEGVMSSEQIAEGKRRANDWLEQHKQAPAGNSSQP